MLRSPWLSLWPTLLFCYKGAQKGLGNAQNGGCPEKVGF
jgi:hypothetical protein